MFSLCLATFVIRYKICSLSSLECYKPLPAFLRPYPKEVANSYERYDLPRVCCYAYCCDIVDKIEWDDFRCNSRIQTRSKLKLSAFLELGSFCSRKRLRNFAWDAGYHKTFDWDVLYGLHSRILYKGKGEEENHWKM